MTLLKFTALLFTGLCFSTLSMRQTQSDSEWQHIDADGQFSFRLPHGFTKTDKTGVETFLGEYCKGETRLLFISGGTAFPAFGERRRPGMRGYQETNYNIRWKRANIRTYWQISRGKRIYRAELIVGNWEKGQVELYMWLESTDPKALETANQIFRSITFPNPIPERSPGQGP